MYNKGARSKWPYPADHLAAAESSAPHDCLQQLDAYIGKVHEAMKPGSLLLVCTGPGDTTQQRCKEVWLAFDNCSPFQSVLHAIFDTECTAAVLLSQYCSASTHRHSQNSADYLEHAYQDDCWT